MNHSVAVWLLVMSLSMTTAFAQPPQRLEFALAIHGGAGSLPETDEWRERRELGLQVALKKGREMLQQGAASLDVVEEVIRILEDCPDFNAGKGAVFNAVGEHELDASIMDGSTRACGAVGGVRTVRNPISLARLVMTQTPHVLLVADGAEKFADQFDPENRIERVPNTYFSTDYQRTKLEEAKRKAAAVDSKGTVGCVVLDKAGNLAAGTSTGGLTNKRFGRLGDSPIVGAGTYADNRNCAVSCTGVGEDFIRHAVAYDISAKMKYSGTSLDEAVAAALNTPGQTVRGGIIAVDSLGQISIHFNTAGMSRAAADSTGRFEFHAGE